MIFFVSFIEKQKGTTNNDNMFLFKFPPYSCRLRTHDNGMIAILEHKNRSEKIKIGLTTDNTVYILDDFEWHDVNHVIHVIHCSQSSEDSNNDSNNESNDDPESVSYTHLTLPTILLV